MSVATARGSVATKANRSEELKAWERWPGPPALPDPDSSEKGQFQF